MPAVDNRLALNLRRFLHWTGAINVPMALTGCCLFGASILPWLKDPLGDVYCAWQLPVYVGWSPHTGFLNYGLLCLCCGLYSIVFIHSGWQPWKKYSDFVYSHKITRFVSFIPVILFLFQYLCADISAIALLANHERQMLLLQQQFGYQGTTQLIMLNPLTLNISTLWERLQLFLNCISYGPLFLCAITWLLPVYHCPQTPQLCSASAYSKRKLTVSCCVAVLLVLFVRAPVGMLCEYVAKEELTAGNYNQALLLLNSARFFNPEFEQAAYYHIEQGQAQYFQSPAQLTTDSRVYLAETYRIQGDYLDAYQQLIAPWHIHPTVAWLVDEIDRTLESSLEFRRPLRGMTMDRINTDDASLPWLHVLLKVDPSNSYAIYVMGRIQYDLHNYRGCIAYMSTLLQSSSKDNIRSSAYTYMALSETGLGNYATARLLLFKAISLDSGYHNNTAREELSGLH
jgi:tetratricopeptide (TPR) repeat protein